MEDANKNQGTLEELIDEVDVEELSKKGHPIPRARRYVIRIDKERVTVHVHTITGREILALVGKTPDQFKLYEHKRGHQPVPIEPDQVVDLHLHRVERFTTMPKGTTEGRETAALRRDFRLPAEDEEYLDGLGLPWETVKDGATQWLFIHDWYIPGAYNRAKASAALLIPANYSDTQIDMVYFQPALQRIDAKSIANLSQQTICGQSWQRWSRHRTALNPWRPGVDNIPNHLGLVDDWLRREFEKA